MKANLEQFPAKNPNPVLSVSKDVIVLYSNEAGEPLLNEWGVRVGGKLPPNIVDLVQRVIRRNSPEKMEVKAGKRTYLLAFHPFLDEECVNIYGFDISCQKEFKEKLRESEEKYHDIIETAIEGIWILDDEFRISYVNKKMAEILGYNQEEMIDRFPWEFADKEGKNIIKLNMEKRQQGISEILETKYIRSDGSSLWAQVSSKSLFDKNGKFTGVLGMLTDITERKRAEEEVKNTSNMLQLIMNNIPQAIFWKDCNSRLLGCNKIFAEDAGVQSPENIVGKTDYDLPWTREQTAWYRECDLRVMKNDTPEYHIIEQQTTADGKLTWLDTNKIPLHDAKGNVIGILGTYEDITERKEAEESLRLLNIYNRSLIETSLDPLVTIGHDGKIMDVNRATEEVTGYTRNELLGTDFSDYFIEPGKARKGYKKVFIDGEVRDYPLEIRHKNGHITPVLYNASVFKDEKGEVIGVFAAARDITERRKVELELKEIQDNLEHFIKVRTAELERAYNSLKESEERLAEAQKMAHLGNWDWNLLNGEMYWSEEMYRIFGKTPQKFSSYSEVISCTHPDDREHVDNAVKKALKGESFAVDHRLVLASGEERTVHAQGDVVYDEKNTPIRMRGTVQDITKRKKTDEKIKILADAVESSNDAIITRSLDDIIIGWNKGAEQIHGFSAEEVLGKHISILEPNSHSGETTRFSEMIKQGKTIQQRETSRLRKDGTIITVSQTLSPVFNTSGKLIAISAIARDVTESKRAEVELYKAEERYRIVTEQTGQLVYDNNLENNVVFWAGAVEEVFGYILKEIKNFNLDDWIKQVHPEDREFVLEKIMKFRDLGGRNYVEYRLRKKDGNYIYVSDTGTYLKSKDGKTYRALGVIKDITQRKQTEETLAKIEIARKQEIHHRIKNNLQVISSLLDLQAERFKDKTSITVTDVLNAFRESQDRVISMALIHEELHNSRNTETIDIFAYVEELAENLFLSYRLGNNDINLDLDIEKDTFFDMDTAVPLGLIVNELLSNSLKYAFVDRDNGKIKIKLHKDETEECKAVDNKSTTFVLSVYDNGIGIPEYLDIENLDSLGLQLVTTLVEQLDGELELKRDNGTEFIIRFAVTERDNQASTSSPQIVDND